MNTFLSIMAIAAVVYYFIYFNCFFTPAHEDGGVEGILTTVLAILSSAYIVFYEWKFSFIPEQYTAEDISVFIIVVFSLLTLFLVGFLVCLIMEEINLKNECHGKLKH